MKTSVLDMEGVINYYMCFISGSRIGGATRLTYQLFPGRLHPLVGLECFERNSLIVQSLMTL